MTATVILLPGNMCDARLWEGGDGVLLRGLHTLGHPVLRPILDADSIEQMAAGVLEMVDGAILPIGFSMGGIVALEIARQAGARVVAMGLLDTNAAADLPERAAHRPRQQSAVRAGRLEQVVIEELKPNYLAAENRGDMRLLSLLRDMALALGPDVFVRQSEALRTRADLTGVLPRFAKPIFLACGVEDRLCPPEWHARWASLAPAAQLCVVAGAGHMLPLEQPVRLAEALIPWLAQIKETAACPIAS